jgi:hypothetical protein
MPLQPQLAQRIEGIRKILMAHHAASTPMAGASKGAEREVLIREFLGKVFPPPFRFGSGTIIDWEGRQSGQLDVVVEFPFLPSFPTPGSDERLYLAESVAFVMEVKSDLAAQWDQVQTTTGKVLPLQRKWKGHIAIGEGADVERMPPSLSRIPSVVVGYKGQASVAALVKRLERTPEKKRPDAAFVVESGAYTSPLTGHSGTGAEGLFELAGDLAYFARNVLTAAPDSAAYVASRTAGTRRIEPAPRADAGGKR